MKTLFPIVTADVALFTVIDGTLKVLLIQRENEPYAGSWALPGVLLKPDKDASLEDTARRALADKTRVEIRHLEQISVFSGIERDPRGYSVAVLFFALLPTDQAPAVAGAKAKDVTWSDVIHLKRQIAFDHREMITLATTRLRQKVGSLILPLHLLPEQFTLTQLQRVCEAIIGTPLDKGSFRRRLRLEKTLAEVSGEFETGAYRPAQLYRAAKGFLFSIELE